MENPNLKLFGWLETQVRKCGSQASVLDIGCGRAQFLGYLAQRNPQLRLTGIELDQFPAPAGVTMLTGDFLTMNIEQRFDCVVSQAVIEHVADVGTFVDRAIQLTKPGGRIMVMTLNEQSVLYGVARLLRATGLPGPFDQLYSKHHLNHFTKVSLARLLTDRGVKIEQRYDHHIPLAAIDFPRQNPLADSVRKLGAQLCFALGELTQHCYLQSVVGQTPVS
jgi:2-polyprenyl-3-methyl-5-hydroxy-6-metoxy-1,4-benzoquinol methylase